MAITCGFYATIIARERAADESDVGADVVKRIAEEGGGEEEATREEEEEENGSASAATGAAE